MRKVIVVLLCISLHASYAQDCKTQAANKPAASVRFTDYIMEPNQPIKATQGIPKFKSQLLTAENWTKRLLNNFTGAKLAYSNDYYFDITGGYAEQLYKATGLKGYCASKMRFYAYYCYDNNEKIFTEAESGSFLEVQFNNVFNYPLTSGAGTNINGKYCFAIQEKSRTEGRVDYYEQLATTDVYQTDYIIIRNSDLPVFTPITRKEYLEQMLKNAEAFKDKRKKEIVEMYKLQLKQFEEEVKIKKVYDKKYTTEKEALERKQVSDRWSDANMAKEITKEENEVREGKLMIQQYFQKSSEWLSKGFNEFYPFDTYPPRGVQEYLDGLDKTREDKVMMQVVSLNPAYYNKSLSQEIPQLIMVHLAKGNYPHTKKAGQLLKQPGVLAPLQALLSGKPATIPIQMAPASVYTVAYLPKLKTLTALTVPAGVKQSIVPVMPASNVSLAGAISFSLPAASSKLKQLPAQPLSAAAYKEYMLDLHAKISVAMKAGEKKKADDYLRDKKLTIPSDVTNMGFAAWFGNASATSLYFYSKAVSANPDVVLDANNFAAFLIMGGLPEKAIPILIYWNKQRPAESTLLSNLGNAYYRLGDMENAMKYLQQCVQKDSLHPVANKLLCMMYLKKGDAKKATDHGSRSISTSHDAEVIAILRSLSNRIKPGEVMSRDPPLPAKEFPMLARIQLPAMPSSLDDMERFRVELNSQRLSFEMTIADIEAKSPGGNNNIQQAILQSFGRGISPLRIKAQAIIMDGMQVYQTDKEQEHDVFMYNLAQLNVPYNAKVKSITKKYAVQLSKLEGGEAGDEDQIDALTSARCKELNVEMQAYLNGLSKVVNQYAQRQEYISRKFFRDYANWAPYWMPEDAISFSSIEGDYLKDIISILGEYPTLSKNNCISAEPLVAKPGKIQKWEDEYCPNYKGKIKLGAVKVTVTCNSFGVEGGELLVGALELNFSDAGELEECTLEAGFGLTMAVGDEKITQIGAGATMKEFIKIGRNSATGKLQVNDFGLKSDVSIEGNIGRVGGEIKLIEGSVAVNAGVSLSGVIPAVLELH